MSEDSDSESEDEEEMSWDQLSQQQLDSQKQLARLTPTGQLLKN